VEFTSDQTGRFTVYLPADAEPTVKLFVNPIDRSSIYDWEVALNNNSQADFVMDDDRIP
jgi:hypothetical protein